MTQQVTNFGRFFAALKALNVCGDPEDIRRCLVAQYTGGRTESLREMSLDEYQRCCADLESRGAGKEELRRQRSQALRLMQQMGVDTSDWKRVNALCTDPRIAGKEFYRLTVDDLKELTRKLRGIEHKGGFRRKPVEMPTAAKPQEQQAKPRAQVIFFPGAIGEA